jgi:hypothetical protein
MKTLFFSFILTIAIAGKAQPGLRNSDKIKNLEIAFITRELNFTTDEAQHFWPVFNNYKKEFKVLSSKKTIDEDILEKQQRILDFRKKYKSEFQKVIPSEKVNQFFIVEAKFREMIRKELKDRQSNKINN